MRVRGKRWNIIIFSKIFIILFFLWSWNSIHFNLISTRSFRYEKRGLSFQTLWYFITAQHLFLSQILEISILSKSICLFYFTFALSDVFTDDNLIFANSNFFLFEFLQKLFILLDVIKFFHLHFHHIILILQFLAMWLQFWHSMKKWSKLCFLKFQRYFYSLLIFYELIVLFLYFFQFFLQIFEILLQGLVSGREGDIFNRFFLKLHFDFIQQSFGVLDFLQWITDLHPNGGELDSFFKFFNSQLSQQIHNFFFNKGDDVLIARVKRNCF